MEVRHAKQEQNMPIQFVIALFPCSYEHDHRNPCQLPALIEGQDFGAHGATVGTHRQFDVLLLRRSAGGLPREPRCYGTLIYCRLETADARNKETR